jgi:DNA-binding CsgD family transcriptional regulator
VLRTCSKKRGGCGHPFPGYYLTSSGHCQECFFYALWLREREPRRVVPAAAPVLPALTPAQLAKLTSKQRAFYLRVAAGVPVLAIARADGRDPRPLWKLLARIREKLGS